jgi:hypothetical protein
MAGGDRDEGTAGKTTKRLTSGATLPVGVIASEARDGAADEWGRLVSERESAGQAGARAGAGQKWAEGRESRARGGGGERPRHGLDSAQQRGRAFLFLFLFSNSFIHFYILFF